MIDRSKVASELHKRQLIGSGAVTYKPLTGGVSSDIWLIESGDHRFVLKQALEQLKVDDFWKADVSRNLAEQDFIQLLSTFRPDAVPSLLIADKEVPYFVMEYLGPPFQSWKSLLLKGNRGEVYPIKAAELLAQIHNKTYRNQQIKDQFKHQQLFYELRIEPYLVTTGLRNEALRPFFEREAQRLASWEEALMHGDFSPKNILVDKDRLVLLDHEVACFGDPAFDVAFFINHLILKSILNFDLWSDMQLPALAWNTYFKLSSSDESQDLMERSSRLLLMLMLARVDGKSPVEYLNEETQCFLRDFVSRFLPSDISGDFHSLLENLTIELKK